MTTKSELSPEDLASIIASMNEGVQLVDRAWRYVFVNQAAAAHGRTTVDALLGRTMMACYPGIDATPMFDLLRRSMEEREPGSMENVFRYPDGRTATFELRFIPCDLGVMILSFDVTERRRLEDQVVQAQKLEAVGRLAGSVAHDFNNALTVILSFSSLILDELSPHDPLHADIQAIKQAGERGADLTRQLLTFSRQQVVAPQLVDVSQALRTSEHTLRRLVGENIELVTHLQRGVDLVIVDPGQLDQVIMNLVVNARDAMPEGGRLTLETRNVTLDANYTNEHFGATIGPHVMIGVSDTGVGMSRETQARIFEPFFTTKEPGKGTGLGLSTVFGIVKRIQGNVWVYSEVGAGTTFKVYLPSAPEPQGGRRKLVATTPHSLSEAPANLRGSETILLVEDQEDVRLVTREILRRYGYHVLEARNAGEALLTCERHPRRIQLMLTDVVMPQMGGRELAERVADLRPDMLVMFMSGYTESGVIQHAILESDVVYLQKPIVPSTLVRKVREVLERD